MIPQLLVVVVVVMMMIIGNKETIRRPIVTKAAVQAFIHSVSRTGQLHETTLCLG
jgi:hypothetical protein